MAKDGAGGPYGSKYNDEHRPKNKVRQTKSGVSVEQFNKDLIKNELRKIKETDKMIQIYSDILQDQNGGQTTKYLIDEIKELTKLNIYLQDNLNKAISIIKELQELDGVPHLDDHFEFLESVEKEKK